MNDYTPNRSFGFAIIKSEFSQGKTYLSGINHNKNPFYSVCKRQRRCPKPYILAVNSWHKGGFYCSLEDDSLYI